MKITIEAEPGEMASKAGDLLKAIAADLAPASPEAELVLEALRGTSAPEGPVDPVVVAARASLLEMAREELLVLEHEIMAALREGEIEKSGVPAGTVHTWADGERMQKQGDGSWAPVVGQRFHINSPDSIAGGLRAEMHINARDGKKVRVNYAGHDWPGTWMHEDSVKHFINDLHGKLDVPESKDPYIEAVRAGKAELLGKGDDGIAFKVGDKVLKVSTTVPFQPMNPGHRTPEDAKNMLRQQSANAKEMIEAGIPGILPSVFVEHGDKGFELKDFIQVVKKPTKEQLDAMQDTIAAMHKHGWILGDEPQFGVDKEGRVLMFDVGKARKSTDKFDRSADADRMRYLYKEHGIPFLPVGDDLQESWKLVHDHENLRRQAKLVPKIALKRITEARDGMLREAAKKYSGKDLEEETAFINEDFETAAKILRGES